MNLIKTISSVAVVSAALMSTAVTPVFAADASPPSTTLGIAGVQSPKLTPEEAAVANQVTELVSAVNAKTLTFDVRKVSAEVMSEQIGQQFATEFSASGGTIINSDGTVMTSSAASALSGTEATAAVAAESSGRIWQDLWGAHMTVPKDLMDRLATLAATGSAGAGGIAALLAVNIEGFPISTTGALASGAVAVGLLRGQLPSVCFGGSCRRFDRGGGGTPTLQH